MEAIKLLETYPAAANIVQQWYLEKMLESLNDKALPEDFKEAVRNEGLDPDRLAQIIEAGPRALFDVFDENHIYIQINILPEDLSATFTHIINNSFVYLIIYNNRKEAERAAIEQAFEILNSKL
jgi:hypothetical protein